SLLKEKFFQHCFLLFVLLRYTKGHTSGLVCFGFNNATVENLLKDSAYKVQIRHRSTHARNPLWSGWSDVTVPAGEVIVFIEIICFHKSPNFAVFVSFAVQPMPHAAAASGVNYSLTDTQSSHGCHCQKNRYPIITPQNTHTTYVSFSAVNISVIAKNAAGYSPRAIVQVPAELAADLKSRPNCCLSANVVTHLYYKYFLCKENYKSVSVTEIKDYVRYLYFEHRCDDGKPQTVKMCIFYEKEGDRKLRDHQKPQDLISFSETHTSVNLSWKAIPLVDQQGFLTHYAVCDFLKVFPHLISSECVNISASLMKYRLENLAPGMKYNISLVGVTRVGKGPEATVTINTLPEKPVNGRCNPSCKYSTV
uniref:Fibronectin type-III domain-containing protein n=1 Tax=Sander lucioperca TaxID=283035 RepID=A0A8D0CNG3_SANLU